MEAHGSRVAAARRRRPPASCPTRSPRRSIEKAGIDRLDALLSAIDITRRGGTVSISGVYGGAVDPLPMMTMFDKGLTLRMGQANVRRWVDDLLPLLTGDGDPLGVLDLRTHRVAAAGRPGGVRDVPEEAGRVHQGGARPARGRMTTRRRGPSRAATWLARRPGPLAVAERARHPVGAAMSTHDTSSTRSTEKAAAPAPEDPRKPDSPDDITKRSWLYVLRKTLREFVQGPVHGPRGGAHVLRRPRDRPCPARRRLGPRPGRRPGEDGRRTS